MIPLHYVRCKSHYEARVAWWESSGVQLNHSRGEFKVNGASFDTRRQPLIMSWQDFTATAMELGFSLHVPEKDQCGTMRTPGVEPGSQAWEACMIPLHYVRYKRH